MSKLKMRFLVVRRSGEQDQVEEEEAAATEASSAAPREIRSSDLEEENGRRLEVKDAARSDSGSLGEYLHEAKRDC
jgi:hypothetical protein